MRSITCKLCLLALNVLAAGAEAPDGRIEGYDKLEPAQTELQPDLVALPTPSPDEAAVTDEKKDDDDKEDRREEDARKMVETVMMVRMAEELGLNDEQTVTMVRRMRELKEEMMVMRRERWSRYRELKEAVKSGADAATAEAKLNALLEYDRKVETFKQDHLDALSEGLAPGQKARLYLFLCEFENDMRHLVHRAQGGTSDWRGRGDSNDSDDWRDRWSRDRDGDGADLGDDNSR